MREVRAPSVYSNTRGWLGFGWIVVGVSAATTALMAFFAADPFLGVIAAAELVIYSALYAAAVGSLDAADMQVQRDWRAARAERLHQRDEPEAT